MQSDSMNLQSVAVPSDFLGNSLRSPRSEVSDSISLEENQPIWFRTQHTSCMEMYADHDTVAEYLGNHQGWFRRCAEPMQTQLIGENAYDLLIGRFGALGHTVEARIGLDLVPPDAEGLYKIRTVPVPGYTPPGYEVDFQAIMRLVELSGADVGYRLGLRSSEIPKVVTGAEWTLDLSVGMQLPKFVRSMSPCLVQKTGEGLLKKIVQQVSRRLSYKTQLDFHTTEGIAFPKNRYRP
ncbi:MAG: DUF1997 domain-containing protein [Microcoleaceae cyanobacterium]